MSLDTGARLGPYEIEEQIGAGGMGEVYRARDTRLDRTVAIKVLLSGLSTDAERRMRFEREARAVSSLSHPHICALHDIGQHDGVDFLVMEHLEGDTLAARLRKGALPIAEVMRTRMYALDYARPALARSDYARLERSAEACLTCSGEPCRGACPNRIPIATRARATARLLA